MHVYTLTKDPSSVMMYNVSKPSYIYIYIVSKFVNIMSESTSLVINFN